jgi:uncharacterized membrane protein SirB2
VSAILDLLFALAVWLKTTPLVKLAVWIQDTPLTALVNSNIWLAPIVQTTHILAIAATVVSVLMISLRIFGLAGKSRTLAQTAALHLPWIWGALAVLLITGLILIIGEPVRELLNPAFWVKMVLVVVAVLVSLGFQGLVRRHADQWEVSQRGTLALRAGAVAVIVLWCLIIVLGRWIAYAPV